MAIKYVRADITTLKVDVIVNSANPSPVIGRGCDQAIYEAAGKDKLLKARKKIGSIDKGNARITSGYNLCKYIIHTVGPNWVDGEHGEFIALRNCYRNSFNLVLENQCKSVAFPLISTGVYGFPKDEALNIAISEINEFLMHHRDIEVTICIFDEDSFVLSGKVADTVNEFINDEIARDKLKDEYGNSYDFVINRAKKTKLTKVNKKADNKYEYELSADESTFAEKLNAYIKFLDEKTGNIYKAAWLPRRTFSRIINGNYIPRKDAALALCLALKLNVEQTVDMLSRNSMCLNPSDKADRFIYKCIKENLYDLEEINKGLVKIDLFDKQFLDRRDFGY